MIPVYQTKLSSTEGNCLQASLASVFEIALDRVPEFHVLYSITDDWHVHLREWLILEFGLQPLYVDKTQGWRLEGYHLILGRTSHNIDHAVVGYRGETVHDPYPGGCGPLSDEVFLVFVTLLENGL